MMDPKQETLDALVKARAELDEALESLERLPVLDPGKVGFIAHALSNYLCVIDGTVQLMSRALKDHDCPDVIRWLEGLDHATDLMGHTLSQLLGSATLQANPSFKIGAVDWSRMAGRLCNYYRKVAARKEIQIEFLSPENVPAVKADVVALAAILDNLLSNAVKYSPPGRMIRVEIRQDAASVECVVCDQGPGISEEDRKKLFQRGVRLSAQPTGGEPSHGFGLAVAKELTEQMGGAIWCESVPGRGACFHVRLPVLESEAQPVSGT
jgi:signal transduction histidine kinase